MGDNPANIEATVTDVAMAKADKANNFINETNKIGIMAKKDDDCGCSTEKAEETETTEVVEEVKSEEVTVEVISPEELPDVVEEEEVKEDEPAELTLEMLAEEMKAMQTKQQAVQKEITEAVMGILTDDQKAAMSKSRGKNKKGGKKTDGNAKDAGQVVSLKLPNMT